MRLNFRKFVYFKIILQTLYIIDSPLHLYTVAYDFAIHLRKPLTGMLFRKRVTFFCGSSKSAKRWPLKLGFIRGKRNQSVFDKSGYYAVWGSVPTLEILFCSVPFCVSHFEGCSNHLCLYFSHLTFFRYYFMNNQFCNFQQLRSHLDIHPMTRVQKRFNFRHVVWSSRTWYISSALFVIVFLSFPSETLC